LSEQWQILFFCFRQLLPMGKNKPVKLNELNKSTT